MSCDVTINPVVVDLSHYNVIDRDLEDARAFGILGVIHKATEGRNYWDRKFSARRFLTNQSGLLWGAYHFLRPGAYDEQMKHFLSVVEPDDKTLVALDHEDERVSARDLLYCCQLVSYAIGRKPVIYSGHLIKQQLGLVANEQLGAHRLWHAQYGPRPIVQRSWVKPWLWQFTGDGQGPKPHNVPGIRIPGNDGIDVNSFDGTAAELAEQWAL